jgi:hypothetical protein
MSFADEMRQNYDSYSATNVLNQIIKDINRMLLEAISDVSQNKRILEGYWQDKSKLFEPSAREYFKLSLDGAEQIKIIEELGKNTQGILDSIAKRGTKAAENLQSINADNQRIHDRVLYQAETDLIISAIKAELYAKGFSHYEVKMQSAGMSQMIVGYRKRNIFDKKPGNITRYTWETDPQFKTVPITEKVPAYALYVKVEW